MMVHPQFWHCFTTISSPENLRHLVGLRITLHTIKSKSVMQVDALEVFEPEIAEEEAAVETEAPAKAKGSS